MRWAADGTSAVGPSTPSDRTGMHCCSSSTVVPSHVRLLVLSESGLIPVAAWLIVVFRIVVVLFRSMFTMSLDVKLPEETGFPQCSSTSGYID